MLRLVLNDYRMDFKHKWKHKKKTGYDLVWMCVCVINLLHSPGHIEVELRKYVWSVAFLMAVWGCIVLGDLYSNTLGKMFYLLPVSQEDRKKYIWTGYWFRVLFLLAVLLVVLLAGMFFVNLEVWRARALMFHFFLLICIRNTYVIADYTVEYGKLGDACEWKKQGRYYLYYLALAGNLSSVLLLSFILIDWLGDCSNQVIIKMDSLFASGTFGTVLCIAEVVLTGVVCFVFWHNMRSGYSENYN